MISLYLPVLRQVLMIGPNPLPVCISWQWLKSKHREGNRTIISSDLHVVDSLGLRMKVKRSAHLYDCLHCNISSYKTNGSRVHECLKICIKDIFLCTTNIIIEINWIFSLFSSAEILTWHCFQKPVFPGF